MQLLGGRAYCENNPVAQIWRDARVTRIFEGPSEVIATYLGQQSLRRESPLLQHLQSLDTGQALQLQAICNSCQSTDAKLSASSLIALGYATAWTMLAVYVQNVPELVGWVAVKRATVAESLLEHTTRTLPDADSLSELIAKQIGLIRLDRAGEQVDLDPYFYDCFP
jgi:hypothetical protein